MSDFVVLLQTPRDEHSAVLIGYEALAAELQAQGHAVTILTASDFPASRSAGRLTPLVYPSAVKRWVRRHIGSYDLFVFHSYGGWRAAGICARAHVPFVIAFHGLEPLYHEELRRSANGDWPLSLRYRVLQERLMPRFLERACRDATLVTCLNSVERAALARWVEPGRIHQARHGVPDAFFAPAREDRPARRLLFVGQWLPMKGVAFLARAAGRLMADHPETALTCAGTLAGEDRVLADFDPTARARIRVLPRVGRTELAALYAQSDIFVFPSLYEGFGRALTEAMAGRLPIVTTRVGVAMDALRDGESCLFVEKRNADRIVAAVERLMEDRAFARRLGEAAGEAAGAYREAAAVRDLSRTLASLVNGTASVYPDRAR